MMCSISDEEYEEYVKGNGISPCSDFGDCALCPWMTGREDGQ